MSRSGRLLLLMDAMRVKRVPVTAAQLAAQLAGEGEAGLSLEEIFLQLTDTAESGAPAGADLPS